MDEHGFDERLREVLKQLNEHPEPNKQLFVKVLQVAKAIYTNRGKNMWKPEDIGKTFGSFLNHKFFEGRFSKDNPLLCGPVRVLKDQAPYSFAVLTRIIEKWGSEILFKDNKFVLHS